MPKEMCPSKVPDGDQRGWIIPIGGAEEKENDPRILRRFVELCGGDQADIVVIPTASRLSDTGARYERIFGELGASRVTAIDFDTRRDCEERNRLQRIEQASGLFFTGGNQLRITTVIGGTTVAQASFAASNARGIPVAGTSAGAAILSEHMIAFGDEGGSPRAGSVGLAPGLGLTNRFIIDQHFRQRDRLGRLTTALAFNPVRHRHRAGRGHRRLHRAGQHPGSRRQRRGHRGRCRRLAVLLDGSGRSRRTGLPARPEHPHPRRGCYLQPAYPPGLAGRSPQTDQGLHHRRAMRILDRSVYVGPSLYAHFPVIRLELDLGALEPGPPRKLGPAFVDALVAALPGLAEHGCSYREPGGFIRRMREGEGTWLGHVLEHVAIELQNVAGEDVTFGKTRSIRWPPRACIRWSTNTRRRKKASPPANWR
jgi:cyanophycinase